MRTATADIQASRLVSRCPLHGWLTVSGIALNDLKDNTFSYIYTHLLTGLYLKMIRIAMANNS